MKNFTTYLGFFVFIPMMIFGQWTLRMAPAPTYLKHVFFINDSVGFAGSFSTFDAGFTWQVDTSAYANFKNAVFTDHLNGFAISDDNLFQSNDGGATWVNISDSVEITNFSNLAAKNGHVIVNGFNNQLGFYWYASVNNGQSWEMRNFHPSRANQVCHIFDENIFFLANTNSGRLEVSNDGGISWDTSNRVGFIDYGVSAIYFATPDTGFIGFNGTFGGGHIEKSVNGIHGFGSPLNHVSDHSHRVFFLNGYNDVICGGGGSGYFYCSPNRGEDWFLQNTPQTNPVPYFNNLYASYFHEENRIAVVGGNGRVLITQTGVEHNLSNSVFEDFTSEVSIYPNPFSQTTSIERSKGNISQIRITNAAGQVCLVKTDIHQSSIQISRSELPRAGLYFVEIFAENRLIERRKLMVVE